MPKERKVVLPVQEEIQPSQLVVMNQHLTKIREEVAGVNKQNEQLLQKLDEQADKIEELQQQLEEAIFRLDYPELGEN